MKLRKLSLSFCGIAALSLSFVACGHKTDASAESTQDTAQELEAAVAEEAAPIELAADSSYTTTESGLKYKVLREGTGRSPQATDVVLVNYEGKLLDGTVFDSSYQRGEPIEFPLNHVIPGWTEGVQLMKEGAEYEFYIPYQLAYGAAGQGPIPPKADLIFKVELLQVK